MFARTETDGESQKGDHSDWLTKVANYKPKLSLFETERAIRELNSHFQGALAERLNLSRVSAPLFVPPESGLNDDLNGDARPVRFDFKCGAEAVIVHSLAKWKRMALARYGFSEGCGLYTNMNAIRRDEDLSPIHSYYVDQWDWELVISRQERTPAKLRTVVRSIYEALRSTEDFVCKMFPQLMKKLPDEITFISSQELEDRYPDLKPKDREHAICREHKAVFLTQIGKALKSGQPHDGRAPDYDDWELNGDILLYYEPLDMAFELSSMGIRVDEQSLTQQLRTTGTVNRMEFEFHRKLLDGQLPLTIGGGIGQSRMCMFLLDKVHIGEVQASMWTKNVLNECEKAGVSLL